MSHPPNSVLLDYSFLGHAITTREMFKKLISKNGRSPRSSITGERRNSKFLSGTSIPNSTIRSTIEDLDKMENSKTPSGSNSEPSMESKSKETVAEEKNNNGDKGLQRMRQKIRDESLKNKELQNNQEEKRRSIDVSKLEFHPMQRRRRRSTLESIHQAIKNSPNESDKLVSADSIEKKSSMKIKFKQHDSSVKKSVRKHMETQTSYFLFERYVNQIKSQ